MEYLEEMEAGVGDKLNPASGEYIMEIELGTTVPFTRTYRIPTYSYEWLVSESLNPFVDTAAETARNHLAELAEEASTWASDNIDTLADRIRPFTRSSAAMYEHNVIGPLEAAHHDLEYEVRDDFGKLRAHLGNNWRGDAYDNFATYFYEPFAETRRSHEKLVVAFIAGIAVSKAILDATRHSLMNAVHYVREELYEQLELRSQAVSRDSDREFFVFAAIAFTVLGGAGGA